MRFLLHNEDAVYDATTKVWHYTLDRRISNPTSLVVKKATFTPVSTLTVHPHVIYMHSTALSEMIIDKHTVVLRGEAHENSTDVIGVLEETHTRGRYALTEREGPFRMSPSANKTVIDIYFTDGSGAHLDGEVDPNAPPPALGAADDSTITALAPDLAAWIDMSYAPLSIATTLVETDGDVVKYLRAKPPASAELLLVAADNVFELTSFGLTKAVVGTGSWAFFTDSGGPPLDITCSLHFMFRAPPTTAAQQIIRVGLEMFVIDWTNNQLRFLSKPAGQQGQYLFITATNFFVNSEWYVEVTHKDVDGDGLSEFYWKFIDLSDPTRTEITETTAGSKISSIASDDWQMSNASDHYSVHMSHLIVLNTSGQLKRAVIRDWMLAKYGVEDGTVAPTPPAPATFLVELDIKQSQR